MRLKRSTRSALQVLGLSLCLWARGAFAQTCPPNGNTASCIIRNVGAGIKECVNGAWSTCYLNDGAYAISGNKYAGSGTTVFTSPGATIRLAESTGTVSGPNESYYCAARQLMSS